MPEVDTVKKEYEELIKQLADPELISDWKKFEELTKKKNSLKKIIEKQNEIEEIKKRIEENKGIVSAKEDPELISLAEEESRVLLEEQRSLEKELENLLKKEVGEVQRKKEDQEPKSIIVEIRAGAGGREASLFAADLFKMYSKYADFQGWKQNILNSHPTELGGFKEIIFELSDGDVFSKMKYEGGVHRVQRIPLTEKSGRIHTSTASVAILPKPKKTQIKIRPDELRIDFYRASGPGGQYVNRRESAVRVTHLPSGISVASQTGRSQLKNKEAAISILEARLLEKKEAEEMEKAGGKRKTQIGKAQRAEKIRTYNFPQDRVTDHRIKKSWHHIEEIMSGHLDPIIQALQKIG